MRGTAVLFALLLAPGALGGTAKEPDLEDGPDQVAPDLDLRAAWVEAESGGLRFTVQVQGATTLTPNRMWLVAFTVASETWAAGVGVDSQGDLRTTLRRPGFHASPDSFRDELPEPALRAGSPAHVSALIPWGAVPGLREGAEVALVFAGTGVHDRMTGTSSDVDVARGEVLLDTRSPFTRVAPFLASLAGALVLGGAVAAFLLWRRRSRAPLSSAADPPPAGPPDPPAGPGEKPQRPRLALDPRR